MDGKRLHKARATQQCLYPPLLVMAPGSASSKYPAHTVLACTPILSQPYPTLPGLGTITTAQDGAQTALGHNTRWILKTIPLSAPDSPTPRASKTLLKPRTGTGEASCRNTQHELPGIPSHCCLVLLVKVIPPGCFGVHPFPRCCLVDEDRHGNSQPPGTTG